MCGSNIFSVEFVQQQRFTSVDSCLLLFLSWLYSFLCVSPSQLTLKEGKKKESSQQPRFDYYNMDQDYEEDVDLSEDELSHIVEIYDFPADFKTEDLLKTFQCYQ